MKSLVQQFRPVLSLPKAAGAEADADFAGVATGEPSPVAIRALLPGDVGPDVGPCWASGASGGIAGARNVQ